MANYLAVDDLTTLSLVDEPVLVDYLYTRYNEDVIYSFIGDILISVNPYKDIPIYSNEFLCREQSARMPHVYTVARNVYNNILTTDSDQCIIISGESGSGKTEICKYLVRQLTELSIGQSAIEQRILKVNLLLEGFGNAQTQMNDNSSRFGKYLQLKFSQSGKVNGAKINEYLLEKSRVVYQNHGERNFHVFYWLIEGLDPIQKQQLHLEDTSKFKYLGGDNMSLHGNEVENFTMLKQCFDLVGFNEEEQYNICVCLTAILHLGNIVVTQDEHEFAHIQQHSEAIDNASSLLGVSSENLVHLLTMSVSSMRKEVINKRLSKLKAEATRDSISKALYDRVFRWIVNQINYLLAPTLEELTYGYDIGILDIFGFENFQHNTFEQLCINLANEQLHNFFIQHIFYSEIEEYGEEGIEGTNVNIKDTQHLLDCFFLGSRSVFHILNDQGSIPRATDYTFLHKINEVLEKEEFYSKAKTSNSEFSIVHFAGQVLYSVESFLEKNNDILPFSVKSILESSENELISLLFKASINPTGTLSLYKKTTSGINRKSRDKKNRARTTKYPTIGSQFKSSLTVLVSKMNLASTHFIRCIKPNKLKSPDNFDREFVLKQLRQTGMLATIEMRRDGFSYRPSFAEFYERFGSIMVCHNEELPLDTKCQLVLNDVGIDHSLYQIGLSKLFLKHHHLSQLEACLQVKNRAAGVLQSIALGFLQRKRYRRMLSARKAHKIELRKFLTKISNDSNRISDRLEKLNTQDDLRELEERRRSDVISGNLTLPRLVPPNDLYVSLPPLLLASDDEDDNEIAKKDFLRKKSLRSKMDECVFVSVKQSKQYYSHQQSRMLRTSVSSSHNWLYGMISQRKAETLLSQQPVGTFLIRVNRKKLGHILSYKAGESISHVTITQLPNGKYVLVSDTSVHSSLDELVTYYTTNPVNSGFYLTNPCPEEEV